MSSISFNLVHPLSIDVYYGLLELNDMGEKIRNKDLDIGDLKVQFQFDALASQYAKTTMGIEKILGSSDILSHQLSILNNRIGMA